MATLRKLFWFALYVVSTLSFVVLFENGTTNFGENLSKRIDAVVDFVKTQANPDAAKDQKKGS